ncbi:MAG: uncharacterized protein KVP18_001342 [Porospora cf. gigantea A]|uniref:uncharacterized protein n=1 Tax=Porospora cf. gigantea A TaxID=2853593 RepID=UPI00355A9130|nr:MAG: hypothetical protein KVP18_001342 [Porospora cf. gigantea A]
MLDRLPAVIVHSILGFLEYSYSYDRCRTANRLRMLSKDVAMLLQQYPCYKSRCLREVPPERRSRCHVVTVTEPSPVLECVEELKVACSDGVGWLPERHPNLRFLAASKATPLSHPLPEYITQLDAELEAPEQLKVLVTTLPFTRLRWLQLSLEFEPNLALEAAMLPDTLRTLVLYSFYVRVKSLPEGLRNLTLKALDFSIDSYPALVSCRMEVWAYQGAPLPNTLKRLKLVQMGEAEFPAAPVGLQQLEIDVVRCPPAWWFPSSLRALDLWCRPWSSPSEGFVDEVREACPNLTRFTLRGQAMITRQVLSQ